MAAGRMHDDELHSDEALVERLIATQFPRWAGLPIERFDSSGTANAIYRLGDDMVVRLPLRPGDRGQLEKEHRWLPSSRRTSRWSYRFLLPQANRPRGSRNAGACIAGSMAKRRRWQPWR